MPLFKKLLATSLLMVSATTLAFDDSGLQELNSIVAHVNTDIITQTELDNAFHIAWDQQQQAEAQGMPATSAEKLKKTVLEQLILQKVQLQIAKQNKITISDKQLNSAIENIAKQHHVTANNLYQQVTQTGFSKADYRQQIRNQIIIMTLHRGVVGNKANVSQEEINTYKSAHSDYLYQVGDMVMESIEQADLAKQALTNQANFHQVAEQYAAGNNSVLSWRPLSGLPDIFASALKNTQINQPAGPIQAPNGLHLLYLLGKKKNPNSLSDEQIHMLLYQQKSQKILTPWLKQLRESSQIIIMDADS